LNDSSPAAGLLRSTGALERADDQQKEVNT
jgi:hypothetical protein